MALGQTSTVTVNAGATTKGPNGASRYSEDGPAARERAPAIVEFDNLLRRRLRVSDPTDALQVADALGRYYPAEKQKIEKEAAGIPFGVAYPQSVIVRSPPERYDLKEALDDVERDLEALTRSPLLEDVRPELRGWAASIRAAISGGQGAARAGLDPRERERVFAHRRSLADFARLARYVGALTPDASDMYRDLATDVDAAAASLMVVLGDTMAEGGITGSRVLPQYPPGDLQARRDAVVLALRALIGTTDAPPVDGWPRGILAHRQVSVLLHAGAASDLRELLTEVGLVRALDTLIDSANASNIESMRGRASSAGLVLDGLRRLILVCQGAVFPDSPNLEAFRVALQQFIDPFEPVNAASGYRIPHIARPALLAGRRGGPQGLDVGTTRLLGLTGMRQSLAENAGYFLQYDYSDDFRVLLQVTVDACLQGLDRSIDLYALGTDINGNGGAEWRAAAFGYLAFATANLVLLRFGDARATLVAGDLAQMSAALVFWWQPGQSLPQSNTLGRTRAIREELTMQLVSEQAWFDLARRMAPSFVGWTRGPTAATPLGAAITMARRLAGVLPINPNFVPRVPRDVPTVLDRAFP
jgi:hypothetical protein